MRDINEIGRSWEHRKWAEYDRELVEFDKRQIARERTPTCPQCGSDNVERVHHRPTWIPECHYWLCMDCEHQWGHE